jgi:hypothetical protein
MQQRQREKGGTAKFDYTVLHFIMANDDYHDQGDASRGNNAGSGFDLIADSDRK